MSVPLSLVFLGGFLASAHCVGMCGGFVIGIGLGANSWRGNLVRQLVYSVGRVCTYVLLGAIAGFAGSWAELRWHHFFDVQAGLSVVAGLLLIGQGLWHLGLIRSNWFGSLQKGPLSTPVCQAARQFGSLLKAPGLSPVFVAGVLTGFLPCALVYANLGLAASASSLATGAATMAAFGLGTFPMLLVTGMGVGLASPHLRGKVMKLAAVCVLFTGLITLSRAYTGFTAQVIGSEIRADCAACATTP
jgi:sulfite exporter TauE/SafE